MIAPGAYQPAAGSHRVVWWDPAILDLNARETMGLRQTKLLEADENQVRSTQGARDYRAWRTRRDELVASGARPSITAAAATRIAASEEYPPLAEAAAITVEQTARVAGRPHGKRFGTLVHAIMSRIKLAADASEVAASAVFYGRLAGAPEAEISAASTAVIAALASPLIARARAGLEIRRESPLSVKLDDGVLAEGVADLAFLEAGGGTHRWVVVDFKTDGDLTPRLTEYRTQVALYLRALSRATNLPAAGVLLWL
jgi:ATP-dependent exoDNAse (exonuclease V) beta subunit